MKLFKGLLIACFSLSLAACNSNDSGSNAAAAPTPSAANDGGTISASGAAVMTSDVTDVDVAAGDVSGEGMGDMTLEEILAAFPSLATRSAFLSSITKVTATDANTLDLYVNDAVVLTLGLNEAGNYVVVAGDLSADSIAYADVSGNGDGQQDQELSSHTLSFNLSECTAVEQEQEQEQGQDKEESKEEVVKEEEPTQEQDQGKEEEQAKEEEQVKEEAPAQECASVEVVLTLEEVAQQQEQDQAKEEEQGKEEEQVKEEVVQDKEESKEQEQVVEDKEESKEQEQSKDDTAEQGQDDDDGIDG